MCRRRPRRDAAHVPHIINFWLERSLFVAKIINGYSARKSISNWLFISTQRTLVASALLTKIVYIRKMCQTLRRACIIAKRKVIILNKSISSAPCGCELRGYTGTVCVKDLYLAQTRQWEGWEDVDKF